MLNREKIFIFLTLTGLRIYSRKPEFNFSLNFDNGELKHQEIRSSQKYGQLLTPVIKKLPPADLILLLADELIYNKHLSSAVEGDFFAEKESFLTMVPFDETKIVHTHVVTGDSIQVIAVNKDLYEPILSIAGQEKKKIRHIVPSFLIRLDQESVPTYGLLEKNYSRDLFKKYDLASADSGIPHAAKTGNDIAADNPEDGNPISPRLLAGIGLLLFLLGVLIFTILLQKQPAANIASVNFDNRAPTPAVTLTSVPQPTVVYKQLQDLKIQVLNGSVLTGQATKLKDALTKMGIAEVVAGNYQTNDMADILLSTSDNLSPDDNAVLLSELKSVFPELSVNKTSTTAAAFDVMIIIGNSSIQ